MPITLSIGEAGHRYGIDHYATRTHTAASAIWGPLINGVNSWGDGDMPYGQLVSSTTNFGNGFSSALLAVRTSVSSMTVSAVSLLKTDTGETLWAAAGSVPVSIYSFANDLADSRIFAGADVINGNSFDNTLQGYGGNDRIDGGAGTDTVVLAGLRSKYTLTPSGAAITAFGTDGTDTLINVERLSFDDYTVAYDTAGTAGQAYRLYQAAFNRAPDKPGLGFQVKTLDSGHSLKAVAQNFLLSPEFARTYGNLTDSTYVTKLYNNVLHRTPIASEVAYHTSAISSGTDRAQLLVNFSESPENQAALIGTISKGMEYTLV